MNHIERIPEEATGNHITRASEPPENPAQSEFDKYPETGAAQRGEMWGKECGECGAKHGVSYPATAERKAYTVLLTINKLGRLDIYLCQRCAFNLIRKLQSATPVDAAMTRKGQATPGVKQLDIFQSTKAKKQAAKDKKAYKNPPKRRTKKNAGE